MREDATIPDPGQSKVVRLAMNLDTLSGNFANEFRGRAVRRGIVNHLHLHLVRVQVLFDYTPQSFSQIVCPRIARRYHYGPNGRQFLARNSRVADGLTTFATEL